MLALYSERIFRSHAIRIRLDWLEECLARVEGQKRGPINDRIVDKIYGEWLSSDLRANGLPTLPETVRLVHVNGPLVLQVRDRVNDSLGKRLEIFYTRSMK